MEDQDRDRAALIEEHKKREARYRTLFEAVQAGVIVQKATGEITYANRVAAEIFGLPVADIMARTSTDPFWKMILEDGTPVLGEDHPSMITLRTGEPSRNAIRGLFADSRETIRWLSINTEPIFEEGSASPSEVIITFVDITDRKRAEEALRESEGRYEALFQASPVSILVVQEGRFIYANQAAAAMMGVAAPEDVVGLSAVDSVAPECRDRVVRRMKNIEAGIPNPPHRNEDHQTRRKRDHHRIDLGAGEDPRPTGDVDPRSGPHRTETGRGGGP